MPTRAWPQPLIAVRDVEASRWFSTEILGAEGGHGGDEYEQIVSGGELVLQRDPDGYRVVVAGPSEYRPRG